MTDALKFFSQEWCDAAHVAVNANPAVYQGFKDPATFTNRMEFGVTGRDDLVCHLAWDRGTVVSWTPRKYDDHDLWIKVTGSLETWQQAAAGQAEGGTLLMAGQIKFTKGPMSSAIENAGALNNFLLTWGQVPTEWAV
ncbi:conserved hypothetical protein (plasmid) [Rhodococcus jostii RHA1]|uniref:SCP2 domain-containing protein n=1 Tax=Rhodococcus jostii (strain RHA1) TaxID=101510 RepID=Q0RUR6_RHOJR|nr:SCP2 sterol-binding domain-containing protein [Rhodococcus jostii]ABH00970.1 conserved hypothetical protein [Rhodococcus jostii RHA1]